jgi:hypothetical protein
MSCVRPTLSYLSAVAVAVWLLPAASVAQGNYDTDADNSQAGAAQPADATGDASAGQEEALVQPAAAEDAQGLSVSVSVEHATSDAQMAGKPVMLRAARPKGPFEPQDPKPAHEFTAVTDDSGRAHFQNIPDTLAEQGLRLHAVTTHGGISFKSPAVVPSDGATLALTVYERGHDASDVVIESLRTVAHVWEDHVFFQQTWLLSVDGDYVVDVDMLDGEAYEEGLPLVLPLKAKGIEARGPGQSTPIKSTVYWRGTLKPGEPVPLTIHFSVAGTKPSLVFDQQLDYPAKNVEVLVPLEPRHERVRIPYFEDLALAAPGFDVDVGRGVLGAQNQGLALHATDGAFEAGESLRFKITGLPFEAPKGAWIAAALGLLGAIFVLGYARRETQLMNESRESGELVDILTEEREALLDELALLEEDYQDGEVSELEYERESLLLRERIALVMKKLRDLEDQAA